MKNYSQLVILCEDLQHAVFARHFLSTMLKINPKRIRVNQSPKSRGSAEQYVRLQLPEELKAFRKAQNHLKVALVIVVDADKLEVSERENQLRKYCKEARIDPPKQNEPILLAIPKRNIETWITYLKGNKVDEKEPYSKYNNESNCKPQVDKLISACQKKQLDEDAPPSLVYCCEQFDRFIALISQ